MEGVTMHSVANADAEQEEHPGFIKILFLADEKDFYSSEFRFHF